MRRLADLRKKYGRDPGEASGSAGKRCPECGVPLRPKDKRCEFCGRKVDPETPAAPPRRAARKPAAKTAINFLKTVGSVGLIVGVLLVVRRNTAERGGPAPLRQPGEVETQRAYKVCEEYIRRHPPATFAVTSIASGLVAAEREGFAVSGTVELQDPAGAAVRRRYSCKVLADPRSGLLVKEGNIY